MLPLLNTQQLAGCLGVKSDTVLRWVRAKKIPAIRISKKIIRYDFEKVLEAIRTQNKKKDIR